MPKFSDVHHPAVLRSTLMPAELASGAQGHHLIDDLIRVRLTADATFYVRPDGSDANDGLSNTAGGAWQTITRAYKWICQNIDLNSYTVTIKLGIPGTYLGGFSTFGDWTSPGDAAFNRSYVPQGGGKIFILGDVSARNSYIIEGSTRIGGNDTAFQIFHPLATLIELRGAKVLARIGQINFGLNRVIWQDVNFTGRSGGWIQISGMSSFSWWDNSTLTIAGDLTRLFQQYSRSMIEWFPDGGVDLTGVTAGKFLVSDGGSLLSAYIGSSSGQFPGKLYELYNYSGLLTYGSVVPAAIAGTTDGRGFAA